MTGVAWVFLAVAAIFAVGNWVAVARDHRVGIYVCKPATLVALVAAALALDPAHSDVRAWFVVALALSLAGDVLLMLPRDAFVAGLAAFLLAHLAYAVGLNLHTEGIWLLAVPVFVAAALVGGRLVDGIRARGEPAMVGPVVAYVLVISVMVASALASGSWVAAAGAVLFMASDALIGQNRFVTPRPWAPVAIMVTYHLGQALLVLSLLG
jgi:uncharacterized membrane protein YhhN